MPDTAAASSPANDQTTDVTAGAASSAGQESPIDRLFAGLPVMEDATLDVSAPSNAADSSSAGAEAPQPEASPADGAPAAATQQTTTPAVADENLPFGLHPRWKEKQEQARRAEERALAAEKRAADLEAATRGVPLDRLQGLATIAAALESPDEQLAEEALATLGPILERLAPLSRSGKPKLPADLAQQVEAGVLPEEVAEEVVRSRALLEAREREMQALMARQQQAQAAALAADVRSKVAAERESWKADPHYEAKNPLIQAEVMRLMQDFGQPRNAQAAVALARMAKQNIDALPEWQAKAAAARKQPVTPLSSDGVSTSTAVPGNDNGAKDPFSGLGVKFV